MNLSLHYKTQPHITKHDTTLNYTTLVNFSHKVNMIYDFTLQNITPQHTTGHKPTAPHNSTRHKTSQHLNFLSKG